MTDQDLHALCEGVADVLASECDGRALHAFVDGKNRLDEVLWRRAVDLGWLAVGLPETYGGLGMGNLGLSAVYRETGRRLAPGPILPTLAGAQWLAHCGSDALKSTWIPRIVNGEARIAVPCTPLGAPGPTLRCDRGRLEGSVSGLLGDATATLAIVQAREESGADCWVLVEIDGAVARLTRQPGWDPTRSICNLQCDAAPAHVVVPAGGRAAARTMLAEQLALGVIGDSIGGAHAIFEQTLAYMKTREQFGQPIAAFQALKHRAANMKVELELAQQLADQAAAAEGCDASMWTLLAKASVTDTYAFVAGDCVQLHGGVGYTWDFDCHLFLKRAMLNQSLVSSNETALDLAADLLQAAALQARSATGLPL